MEEEYNISKDLLKTLSADTRVQILKSLEKRPMTASELSRFLNKHVTTITEHLELLLKSRLVERIERPGRKWIYYKLTREGKRILHPESYRWVMVLSLVFFLIVGSFFVWNVDAYPGQFFYPLKRARESFQLLLAKNSLEKAERHLQFAEERLKEAKVMANEGKLEYVKRALSEYQREIKAAEEEMRKARLRKFDVIPLLEKMSEVTPKHASMLENLAVRSPKLRKIVAPALNVSVQGHESSIKELRSITGRPYAKALAVPNP